MGDDERRAFSVYPSFPKGHGIWFGSTMQDGDTGLETPRATADELRLAWGLTPAEARLAHLLLLPLSLQESARHLGISSETARTHLKALFGKTRTHRQAELLVKLLSTVR